ncbi:UNVERIFIED_CONTAM: hypothetical protein FKN15_055415 [Acipenser sinensis]
MKRFRRHGQDSHRDRLKQDLFQFNKTVEHGFPHQPSALGYSPSLRLMAIGTRSGAIKLYPSLPCSKLVTLMDDNSLHLWALRSHEGVSELLEEGRFTLPAAPGAPPSVTRVTSILAHSSGKLLYLGTEGGHVFVVEVPVFRELEERNISVEAVQQRVPEEYVGRRNLESVEALTENPQNPDHILIGYSRGLMVLWDLEGSQATHHFLGNQQLESVWWKRNGRQIISAHNDGSYCQWPVSSADRQPEPDKHEMPYGEAQSRDLS